MAGLGDKNALVVCKLPKAPNPVAGLTSELPPKAEVECWLLELDVAENDPNMLLTALESVGCLLPNAKPPNAGVESDIEASRVMADESAGGVVWLALVAGAPKLP